MDDHDDPAVMQQVKTAGMIGRSVARLDNSAMARWVWRGAALLLLIIVAMGAYIINQQLKGDADRAERIESGISRMTGKLDEQNQKLITIQTNTAVQDQRIERAFDRLGEHGRRIEKIENKVFP